MFFVVTKEKFALGQQKNPMILLPCQPKFVALSEQSRCTLPAQVCCRARPNRFCCTASTRHIASTGSFTCQAKADSVALQAQGTLSARVSCTARPKDIMMHCKHNARCKHRFAALPAQSTFCCIASTNTLPAQSTFCHAARTFQSQLDYLSIVCSCCKAFPMDLTLSLVCTAAPIRTIWLVGFGNFYFLIC